MKGIFVRFNLENEDWTDEEYENQVEREIFIPISVLNDHIRDALNLDRKESVDNIWQIKEVH